MKLLRILSKCAEAVALPVRKNARFFFWMYMLGVVSSLVTLPKAPHIHLYGNLWLELLLDVYVLCLLLCLFPQRLRRWVRLLFCVVAYGVALVDAFCFVKFDATLNPTMLLLVGETTGNEASEFLSSYLGWDVLFSGVGVILLVMVGHVATAIGARGKEQGARGKNCSLHAFMQRMKLSSCPLPLAPCLLGITLAFAVYSSFHNKQEMVRMFTRTTIGQVEHELTRKDCAQFYQPVYRLAFSIFSNQLASQQVTRLKAAQKEVAVDSCDYRSPCIVLIIGESYNKYHSQLYGYDKETTPRQVERQKTGRLVAFSDVVAPWNLTSFVFKNVFSTHVVGQEGEWCDYPLFPTVFRKAGYQVTFITNQFLPKAKEAVYDFSGGFFLNNPELSRAQFDLRNTQVHHFDTGILKDYDRMVANGSITSHPSPLTSHPSPLTSSKGNLIIFHVMGQHVNYNQRYQKSQRHWYADDYDRPDLPKKKRDILSHYDNATLYNDSIVDQILCRFEDKDAVVIYVSDHGEEVFNDGFSGFGRNHSAAIDARLAHQEFDVPFWVWFSHDYAVNHPDIFSEVVAAKDRRLMTDALPHLLFYLAGIHTKDYHPEYNVLSPDYDELRPRIIKAKVDYDSLMKDE